MSRQLQKLNLHERLKKHAFEHAFITTFTFGARFFEDYALENFKSLQDNGNVTVLIDEGEYQDLLRSAVDAPEFFPKQSNLRYLLHPVRVPGVFHPKVFLFASKQRGLLVIGSANFTQDGLGSNAEMVVAFDYEEGKNEESLPLFQAALGFFEQLGSRWPSEQFQSNLQAMVADVPWFSKVGDGSGASGLPELLTNLDAPLWDQLIDRLPCPASHVSVLSRFFDAKPTLADVALTTTKARNLTLYTQNGITTLTKAWLESEAFDQGRLAIQLCRYADEEHYQQLHGKAFAFRCGKEVLLAIGSANFTSAALKRTASNGNLEVLLCYPPVSAKQVSPESLFDPDGKGVSLLASGQLQTATDNSDESSASPVSFSIRISEALVDEHLLKLTADGSKVPGGVRCRLVQSDRSPIFLLVKSISNGALRCELTEAEQRRLRTAPTLADIGSLSRENKWEPLSHPVLVTNLQDIRTGSDLRRERQIREARESPQRFMSVLAALCSNGDEERLKQFLTYCNIPMDLPIRLLRRKPVDKQAFADTAEALRVPGARNLRYFEFLHEAVMDFSRRHRKSLERHVDSGIANGVPNFLHILLTVCNLLLSQIARIIAALEADASLEMTPSKWHQVRDILDAYYRELRDLFRLTTVDYLNALRDDPKPNRINEPFIESLDELLSVLGSARQQAENIARLQQERLVVVMPDGRRVTGPGFFKSVLAPENWPAYEHEIERYREELQLRFAA